MSNYCRIMMHFNRLLALLPVLLLFLGPAIPVHAQSQEMNGLGPGPVRLYGPLRVINLDDQPDRKTQIEEIALEARQKVRQGTRLDWDDTAYIIWIESRDEFESQTSFVTEHTFAAASPERNTIWINASAWNRSTPEERVQGMTHEMGHLLLGSLSEGTAIPLWANEGIVQHLAGQWNSQRSQSLSVGRAIDAIPSLSELELKFPDDPNQRELAYLISYQAVEKVIREYGDENADIRVLLYLLSGDRRDELISALWDADNRNRWNANAFESVGSPWIHWVMGVFSHTSFWIIIMFLVIAAWIKIRIQRAKRDREEMEEVWDRNLTQANIVEIYGPREGEGIPEELTPWDRHQLEKEENPDPEPWRRD